MMIFEHAGINLTTLLFSLAEPHIGNLLVGTAHIWVGVDDFHALERMLAAGIDREI